MSLKKYASPLRLEVYPSPRLSFLLLVLHLAAIGLFVFLAFDIVITVLGIMLMLVSAYFTIQKYGRQKLASAVVRVVWDADDVWQLETLNGQYFTMTLLPDSYVHPSISILRFNPISGQQFAWGSLIILLKDNVDADSFRRLRVRLKVGNPIE